MAWLAVLGFLSACEVEDCRSTHSNDLNLRFFEDDSSRMKNVRLTWLETVGNPVIFQGDSSVGILRLQVNPATNETIFNMRYLDSVRVGNRRELQELSRYLKVTYDRRQRIITPECGVEQAFVNVTIDSTNFIAYRQVARSLDIFNRHQIEIFQ
ncbi:MAG: hypothetical protein JJU28_01455 [Cyclobacteriaceae bacterium]|nr:hypothetical protein [Cyclobacteriaceae bacterium]